MFLHWNLYVDNLCEIPESPACAPKYYLQRLVLQCVFSCVICGEWDRGEGFGYWKWSQEGWRWGLWGNNKLNVPPPDHIEARVLTVLIICLEWLYACVCAFVRVCVCVLRPCSSCWEVKGLSRESRGPSLSVRNLKRPPSSSQEWDSAAPFIHSPQ